MSVRKREEKKKKSTESASGASCTCVENLTKIERTLFKKKYFIYRTRLENESGGENMIMLRVTEGDVPGKKRGTAHPAWTHGSSLSSDPSTAIVR